MVSPSEAKSTAQSYINDNPVMVFSKSYCPYCKATKELLKRKNANFLAIELDQMGSEGQAIQNALRDITGQSSVPNIFIAKEHVGGNSDLQAKGDLDEALKNAGAV